MKEQGLSIFVAMSNVVTDNNVFDKYLLMYKCPGVGNKLIEDSFEPFCDFIRSNEEIKAANEVQMAGQEQGSQLVHWEL